VSAADIVTVIAALGVLVTSVATAVGTVIVALRTSQIKKIGEATAVTTDQIKATGEATHELSNSQNDNLRALVGKQGQEMFDAGLPPTVDDSLSERKRHNG
jgi:hypothetical protein